MKNKKTPDIRFKGFTDDWEQRKLSDIADVRDGTHDSPQYVDEGYPFITSKNVSNGYITYDDIHYISEKDFNEINKRSKVNAHDILMGMIGTIGNLALIREKTNFAIKNVALIKYTGCVNYNFLYQALQSPLVVNQLSGTLDGGTQKFISLGKIRKLSIPYSGEEEANKIGAYLENLDSLITLHQRKLEKLKKFKKAMLEKMFPKNGEKTPKIRFQGFTDDWEQRKVSDMFKLTRGNVLPATVISPNLDDINCYPVYSSQTLNNGLMGYYKTFLYENAVTWTTDGANAGTVRYRAGKFYCTNVCGVLLSDEVKASKMIAEALNNVAKRHVSYVGNPKLMNNVMAEIAVLLPTNSKERKAISNILDAFDTLITLHQRKLEKLKQIKKAMLEKMFV